MWRGIVTLTTVGCGDVTPVTFWGRMAGGLTAVMGLSLFAIPVGIIASAFIEAARRREFIDTWNFNEGRQRQSYSYRKLNHTSDKR